MYTFMEVRCPNCGSPAHRHLYDEGLSRCQSCPDQQVAQTECPECDYLMVICWKDGKVLEAHSPGRSGILASCSSPQPYPIYARPQVGISRAIARTLA